MGISLSLMSDRSTSITQGESPDAPFCDRHTFSRYIEDTQKGTDARLVHPDLRPPIDPRELKVNAANGMKVWRSNSYLPFRNLTHSAKNYIATEGYSWDTSAAFIRRTLTQCIRLGRKARGKDNETMWEAFRLLGTGLHTLEDFLAHSESGC